MWEEGSAYYKVGITCNMKKRKIAVQNGNPHPLHLIKLVGMPNYDTCLETEGEIKSKWEQCRVRLNSEWYIFDHKEVATVERCIDRNAKN